VSGKAQKLGFCFNFSNSVQEKQNKLQRSQQGAVLDISSFLIISGMAVTLTFDLFASKSNQFIFVSYEHQSFKFGEIPWSSL